MTDVGKYVSLAPNENITHDILKNNVSLFINEINGIYETLADKIKVLENMSKLMQTETDIRSEYGEYIGYNMGLVDSAASIIDSSLTNLEKIKDGEMDLVSIGAASLYSTVWYEMAKHELGNIASIVTDMLIVEQELFNGDSSTALLFQDMQSTRIH